MSRLAALESLAALVAAGNTDPDRLQVIAEAIPEYGEEDTLRAHLALEADPADVAFANPSDRAMIAAVRGWAGNAAWTCVLLDAAHVARTWSDGADLNARRADDLLRLRDAWHAVEDPEVLAQEVADGQHRPTAPDPMLAVLASLERCAEVLGYVEDGDAGALDLVPTVRAAAVAALRAAGVATDDEEPTS